MSNVSARRPRCRGMLDAHGIVETYFFKLLAQQKARSFSCKSIEANDASDRARSRAYVQSMRPTGGFRMIYFLACIAAIAGFLFGYDEGIIAVARPLLDKDFPMSPVVGGFMTAAVPLGALIGASLAGRITDRFGRRRVLMSAAALFAVGALIAAGMTAVWILVAARLVLGLAIGVRRSHRAALHFRSSAGVNPRRAGGDLSARDHIRHPGVLPDRPRHRRRRNVAPDVRNSARCPDCCSCSASPSCRNRRAG